MTGSGIIRDFLRTGGRVLIDPDGTLIEGAGVPRDLILGSDKQRDECMRAARAYFALRDQPAGARQIERSVRVCGRNAVNGWLVLAGAGPC